MKIIWSLLLITLATTCFAQEQKSISIKLDGLSDPTKPPSRLEKIAIISPNIQKTFSIQPHQIKMILTQEHGNLVVINETSYAEGDKIQGHTIQKIHPHMIEIITPTGLREISFAHPIKTFNSSESKRSQ